MKSLKEIIGMNKLKSHLKMNEYEKDEENGIYDFAKDSLKTKISSFLYNLNNNNNSDFLVENNIKQSYNKNKITDKEWEDFCNEFGLKDI